MKSLLLIMAAAVLVSSCRSSRNVQKSSSSIDSTAFKRERTVLTSVEAFSIETKNVSMISDTVLTRADSVKTDFSYNTADSSDEIEVQIESGSIMAMARFNKRTGKGSLEAKKKPEEIPVNRYLEETSKINYSRNDSSGKEFLDSSHFKRTATGKITTRVSGFNRTLLIVFVLLVVIVVFYFWLRNQYKNPTR